jgi:hypothetical protein
MGQFRYALVAMLLATMIFSSCECNRTEPPLDEEPAFPERSTGFDVDKTPLAKPTPTPAAPTPTEPAKEEPTPQVDVRIPDDFPSEVPLYKDAELTLVQPTAGNGHNIVLRTSDDVSKVHRFYQDDMQKKGWKMSQEFERGEHSFATYQKGNTMINVTIASDAENPGKQVIAIMYYDEEPLPFDEF